jgi:pimeloyl-ACP methyl ester carboxylesterase/NAD(P)-dependent dehydrogenase (short-subunit alcohol dehydrogenase family)
MSPYGTFISIGIVSKGIMPNVQTNDIETYYELRGKGPTLVFIHAALVDHSMWEPQLDALSAEYTTIAYDVRGHGQTGGSAVDSYTIDLFADDLNAFLTALNIEQPVLCGASMGGAIAQEYATRHPDSIAGLVLADTFTPERLNWRDRLVPISLNAQILPVRLFGLARAQRAGAWVHERFTKGASGEYGTIEQLQADMPPIPFEEFVKIIRSLTSFPRLSVDLRAITVPTLVVYGENTLGYIRRHAAKMGAEIPNATVTEVPGGGHACPLDNPAFFTAAFREFLSRRVYRDGVVNEPEDTLSSSGEERIVVITGANEGIGYHTLTALLVKGYRVAGLDIDGENIQPLQETYPGRVRFYECDVTVDDDVETAIEGIIDEWGKIDILLNNAAIFTFRFFEDRTVDDTREEFEVNYFGYLRTIRAVLPHMRARNKGIIHNMSSGVGRVGNPGLSGYASTKGAVEAFTRSLRLELQHENVSCTVMHPPLTNTRSATTLEYPEYMYSDPADVGRKLADKIESTDPVITADWKVKIGLYITQRFPFIVREATERFLEEHEATAEQP